MARISLEEAYDNRDVIAWLVKHEDEIDELMNILKDITPNGDLTNVVTKTGDQTIDGIKTFIGKIVADCDIIQNGGNYETHAEQVFTTNDYIVMRDGAVSGLGTGQFSGFQVKKYNGSDDGRLVMDNSGIARVGDIGDEQPLATRDEAASMTSGALVKWDGVNEKMIAPASNVGTDTKPVKIVNGIPVAVTDALQKEIVAQTITPVLNGITNVTVTRVGKIVQINFNNTNIDNVPDNTLMISGIPTVTYGCAHNLIQWNSGANGGMLLANPGNNGFFKYLQVGLGNYYGTITYITDDP